MEDESKKSLIQEDVELFEGKVVFQNVGVIQSQIHHEEDDTEDTSVKRKYDALKSSLSLTKKSPEKMQVTAKVDSKKEMVVAKTKKDDTLSLDAQIVEAPESLLVNQQDQNLSSVKVCVQSENSVASKKTNLARKPVILKETASKTMNETSSVRVSSDQHWTQTLPTPTLFSSVTDVPTRKQEHMSPTDDVSMMISKKIMKKEDIIPLEQSLQPTTATALPTEGYQSRKLSSMVSADQAGPSEGRATRDEENPDKERAEGICFS